MFKWLFANLLPGDAIVVCLCILFVILVIATICVWWFLSNRAQLRIRYYETLTRMAESAERWDADINDRISGLPGDCGWIDLEKFRETEIR